MNIGFYSPFFGFGYQQASAYVIQSPTCPYYEPLPMYRITALYSESPTLILQTNWASPIHLRQAMRMDSRHSPPCLIPNASPSPPEQPVASPARRSQTERQAAPNPH